jgi:hypothetical protein
MHWIIVMANPIFILKRITFPNCTATIEQFRIPLGFGNKKAPMHNWAEKCHWRHRSFPVLLESGGTSAKQARHQLNYFRKATTISSIEKMAFDCFILNSVTLVLQVFLTARGKTKKITTLCTSTWRAGGHTFLQFLSALRNPVGSN